MIIITVIIIYLKEVFLNRRRSVKSISTQELLLDKGMVDFCSDALYHIHFSGSKVGGKINNRMHKPF